MKGKHVGVILISLISGYAAMKTHNAWHAAFGTGLGSILGITAILTLLAGAGYDLWITLTDIEFNKTIYYLTLASTAAVHYPSHYIATDFIVVGDIVFWLFTLGTAANYYLTTKGLNV
jgi:hypothetical protein